MLQMTTIVIELLSGTTYQINNVELSSQLIYFKKQIAESLDKPWYYVVLCVGHTSYSSEYDGRTLQELGIDGSVTLQCILCEPWKSSPLVLDLTSNHPPEETVSFYPHDNGGRPFHVILDGSNTIMVQTLTDIVRFSQVEYIFIGQDRRNPSEVTTTTTTTETTKRTATTTISTTTTTMGNSVLLKLCDEQSDLHKYVFIGECIYSFYTEEPILHYFSEIGNNDVPYPVALGPSKVYFMLDHRTMQRSLFGEPSRLEAWEGMYSIFYESGSSSKKPFFCSELICTSSYD